MIKNLFVIAGASFVLAAFCFAGAGALGWRDWFGHRWDGNWTVRMNDNGDVISHIRDDGDHASGDGATTREIAWNGGDSLDVDLPADVQFTQAPGPAKLTVSGPSDLVSRVVVSGSHLGFDGDTGWNLGRLSVVMNAPNVHRFAIDGDSNLSISGYDQDELDVDVSGHGQVTGKGKARAAQVDISGAGDVNLGALPTDSAEADISGFGRASLAPASAADLRISGAGEIDLLTHPAKLTTDVSGAGRIVENAPAQKPS